MSLFPKNTCLAALKQNVHWSLLSKATLPLVDRLNDHVVSCYITKGELGWYRQLCSTDGGQRKCDRFPIDFRANFLLADSYHHDYPKGNPSTVQFAKFYDFLLFRRSYNLKNIFQFQHWRVAKNHFRKYYTTPFNREVISQSE